MDLGPNKKEIKYLLRLEAGMAKKAKLQKEVESVNVHPMKPTRSLQQRDWISLVLILVTCFISFYPSLKNNFINWDDNAHVFANPQLKEPLGRALSYYFGAHTVIGNYIPVTMLVYLLEYKMGGMNPSFFHGFNLLLHLVNVCMVYVFIRRLSGNRWMVAALVALVFGVHPMHVESVVWISELKDVLYTLFFLGALISYESYLTHERDKPNEKVGFPLLCLTLFLLSLLSKPAAIVLPLVLLLLDYYTARPMRARVFLEKIPFFLLSVLFAFIALKAQHADRLLHSDYSIFDRVCIGSYAFLNYLAKFFIPLHQSIFYPYPTKVDGYLPGIIYISPLIVLLLAGVVYSLRKKSRALVFGALFLLVNLVLVLQLVSFGDAFMAERYTYVAYIGLAFVLAMEAHHLYETNRYKVLRLLLAPLTIFACLLFAFTTYQRTKVWKDDYSIAIDLVQKYPNDWLSLNNMGYILFEQKQYEESIGYFEKALLIKPGYTRASINLCNTFLQLNAVDRALRVLDSALTKEPDNHYLLANKGNILFHSYQRYAEAASCFEKALRDETSNITAFLDLAECYYYLKDYTKALAVLDRALQYHPNNHIIYNNKGYIYFLQGRYTEALQQYDICLKIYPGYQLAKDNLKACKEAMEAQKK